MKQIFFILLLIAATTGISFAQSPADIKTDSTSTHAPQVEFYGSEEAFHEKNPSYFIHLTIFFVVEEVHTEVIKNLEPRKRELFEAVL